MTIKIINRYTDQEILIVEADSLRGANLYGADLYGANLRGANLRGADLYGAKAPWMSHDFLAEVLRREAGDDIDKRKVAGLILVSRDWCWRNFWAIEDPLKDWVVQVLKPWAEVEGSNPPDLLKAALGMPVESDDEDDEDEEDD